MLSGVAVNNTAADKQAAAPTHQFLLSNSTSEGREADEQPATPLSKKANVRFLRAEVMATREKFAEPTRKMLDFNQAGRGLRTALQNNDGDVALLMTRWTGLSKDYSIEEAAEV